MSVRSDSGALAGSPPRSASPTGLLFINTSNPLESAQAFNRKKARSHIMNRYHKKTRQFRVSQQPVINMDFGRGRKAFG
jgi:hypothetical protein